MKKRFLSMTMAAVLEFHLPHAAEAQVRHLQTAQMVQKIQTQQQAQRQLRNRQETGQHPLMWQTKTNHYVGLTVSLPTVLQGNLI